MTDHQEGLAEVIAAMRKAAEDDRESAGPRDYLEPVTARDYVFRSIGIEHAANMLAAYHARLTTGRAACERCKGRGTITVHGGGSGDPEWDADDQPCPECGGET